MTALADLLAAVEADAAQAGDFYGAFADDHLDIAQLTYEYGNLNAAFALYQNFLGGTRIEIFGPTDDGEFGVTIGSQDTVFHAAPARALLIATLRALVEKEKTR